MLEKHHKIIFYYLLMFQNNILKLILINASLFSAFMLTFNKYNHYTTSCTFIRAHLNATFNIYLMNIIIGLFLSVPFSRTHLNASI